MRGHSENLASLIIQSDGRILKVRYIILIITHTSRFCQAIEIQYFASSFMFLALRAVNIS